ncbi:hypothetical protein [Flavobacterium laiguense]|uniref:Uncharacterized protein n=1 Tax=Flavobacterium laiguense TaxID=2169409 RepID=A0A2U1JWE8_9FLAO|nr:hypothetical protein [Flavobacterium laiguense]PWA09531.1 hypothetical protein DB891_07565 [Flavobacterium laiguense]
MITEKQKETIIEVLGKQFSRLIIQHLTKKKIFNANGHEFSPASIQKIVSGKQPNETVELEIAKLVAKIKNKKKKAQETKNKLFK